MFRNQIARTAMLGRRAFTTTRASFVKKGDSVPKSKLYEDAPSKAVDLQSETAKGKYIVVGVPGAFSPGCSASHVPGYWKAFDSFSTKGVDGIYVIAVNDAFVTGEWKKAFGLQLGTENPGIRFLADPKAEFSKAWDVAFDASKFFGNERSMRYAAVVENGKVTETFVEPDATGINVSAADKVLSAL